MNALTNIYTNLSAAIFDAGIGVEFVDIDLGQLKKNGENIPIDYPAVLIKLENIAWKTEESGKQKGLVHVRLKIIYPYTEEFYIADGRIRNEVQSFFDLLTRIQGGVQSIPTGNHSRLFRINECHLDSLPEEMKWIYAIDYQCNIWEDGSEIEYEELDTDYDLIAVENRFFERTINAERVN